MAVGVNHKRGVIVRAIMKAKTGTAVVASAMSKRRPMKIVNGLAVGCQKGQMKAGTGRMRIETLFDRKLVAAPGHTIADCLIRFVRADILPNADVAKWRECGIVKCRGSQQVGYTEG